MRITILTYGSRGDVQPFLALAVGLQSAGHSVRLAAPFSFSDFVKQHNISFVPLPGDPEQLSALFNDAGQNPLRIVRSISNYIFSIAPDVIEAAITACDNAECIIHGFLFTAGGHTIACQRGIPDISVQTFPMFAPTRAFPNVSAAKLAPGWFSYASHVLANLIFQYGGNIGYSRIMRAHPDLPLKPPLSWPFTQSGSRPRTPLVFAFSPSVVHPPNEWNNLPHLHIPGYLFLKGESFLPPRMLTDFLNAGSPPVCITFGSMINRDMEHIRSAVLEGLQRAHQRAIIVTGWGNWGHVFSPGEDILTLKSISHDWLFPRCQMVIHHGGAGTTAAALRAGVPSLAIPHAGDQPFWAHRLDELGVGPGSIPLKKISTEKIVEAIVDGRSQLFRERAQELGYQILSEEGVGTTVSLVEAHVARFTKGNSNLQP